MDAAVGPIAIARDLLRETLANCTAFQTWDGNSWTSAQAKQRIYQGTMPLSDDLLALEAARPFAVIVPADSPCTIVKVAAPRSYRASGTLTIEFHRTPPALSQGDPGDSDRELENTVGLIMQSNDANSPGLCELAQTAGYLTIRGLRAYGPYRIDPQVVPAAGDCQIMFVDVDWGVVA